MSMWDKFLNFMGFTEADEVEEELQESPLEEIKKKRGRLVALPNSKDNVKVIVVEPSSFEDAQIIADNLKNRQAVIVNLEKADYELGKRIIDFVGGTAYAIDGSMQKIGQGIILAVPPNVDINSELTENYVEEQEEVFSWVSKFHKKGERF